MSIDPRLIERRREVAEDRARRNVTRLVRLIVVLGILGAGAWFLLSPLLSVKEVITTGIVASSAHGTLVEEGVLAGTPLILIRADLVEEDLERDPWVKEAVVEVDWPDTVVVRIEERVPVAWVETGDGWDRRAVDGVVLPSAGEPDDSMPRARFPDLAASTAEVDPLVLGALQFSSALGADLRAVAVVFPEENGELWAEVAGFSVRLGRPIEMEAKARSLDALLREQPAEGSILNLIAPTHPAASVPEENQEQP